MMTAQIRGSGPEDPLEGYSGLALFPRTLASIPNAPKPYDLHDLHHVHNFLKSMTLPSPNMILEETKAVEDSSSGLAGSGVPSYLTSKDKNEHAAAKGTENPQERRPALGRKRARFSLKPYSSQPTVNLETSLDIDKLKDPEEFFLAFEKLEDARKELQKQTGGDFVDLNPQNPSIAARPRRPGILGRSVKYKHRYSDALSSQETLLEESILSPSGYIVQQEKTNQDNASLESELADAALQETELAGSIAKSEKKVNDLLDELLSDNCGGLDGDDPISLLQERLQIKPIDLEKLHLPELQAVRRIDLKASGAKLPKPRHVLSDIQNLLKGVSSKTPKKHKQAESPVSSLASPTPAKSPLSSIISLKQRILLSNSLSDPYFPHDIDLSTAKNHPASDSIGTEADKVNMEKELSTYTEVKSSMMEESDAADINLGLSHGMTGNATHSSDKTVNDNLTRLGSGVGVVSIGSHASVENENHSGCMEIRVVNEILARSDAVSDPQTTGPNELDDKVHEKDTLHEAGDFLCPDLNMKDSTVEILNSSQNQENLPVVEDRASDGPSNTADTDPGQHKEKTQIATEEPLNDQNKVKAHPLKKSNREKVSRRKRLAGQANHLVVEEHAMDGSSNTAETGPEKHTKEVLSTGEPLNQQSKVMSRPSKKSRRDEISRRESLAASGTLWESGRRRSTRIKSRPLEYWKGERFLYGRVHQSLTTVIGIKYASPGTSDGKPTVKVKSYVSDKYKYLVDLAARF
ncbi:centromere protein C [Mangifera indica]|uniref:centromere protein C n=1 Tax=Mangifera indica TaxID=29780 RepID=UPI001CFBA064|nr:centromere protein C [Mangifera indica]